VLRDYVDTIYYIEHDNSCHSLQKVESFKDLKLNFENKLAFDGHINEKINKAYMYSVLGIIKTNFICDDKSTYHFLV